MKLKIERKWKKDTYTIGKLYIDDNFFCNTLEDKDRGLNNKMSLEEVKKIKKPGITAIPTGTYNIRMDVVSPKYSKSSWYLNNCNGSRMPRLDNVIGYQGVLIHPGNTDADSEGCILVGKNDVKGKVTKSKDYFLQLYKTLYTAYKRGEKIEVTII